MNIQVLTIRPVSTHLAGFLLPLVEVGGRWDEIQIQVLPRADENCTGWGLFPVLAGGELDACELLAADERVAAAALDALQADERQREEN